MAQLAMQRKRFMEASQLAGEKTENEEGEVSGQDAKSGGASSSSSGNFFLFFSKNWKKLIQKYSI